VNNPIKLVLDLNLFISALIGKPATKALLDHWRSNHFVLVLSRELAVQLLQVVARPKFKNNFTDAQAQELSELILENAQFVEPTLTLTLCRDAKDNILLEIAATAKANYLVTGDGDLLDDPVLIKTMFDEYGVEVIRAREMLEILDDRLKRGAL
jgi:uncharacterized protein